MKKMLATTLGICLTVSLLLPSMSTEVFGHTARSNQHTRGEGDVPQFQPDFSHMVENKGDIRKTGVGNELLEKYQVDLDAPTIQNAHNLYFDTKSKITESEIIGHIKAYDKDSKDITSSIEYTENITRGKAGKYPITYSVTDTYGKKTQVKATAIVGEKVQYIGNLKNKPTITKKSNGYYEVEVDIPENYEYFIANFSTLENIKGSIDLKVLVDFSQYNFTLTNGNKIEDLIKIKLDGAKKLTLGAKFSDNVINEEIWDKTRLSYAKDAKYSAERISLEWKLEEAIYQNTDNFTKFEKDNLNKIVKVARNLVNDLKVSDKDLKEVNRMLSNAIYQLPLNPLDVFSDMSMSSLLPEYNSPEKINRVIRDSIIDNLYQENKKFLDIAYEISENKQTFKNETFTVSRKGSDNAKYKDFTLRMTHADPTGQYIVPGEKVTFYLESDRELKLMLYNSPESRFSTILTIKPGMNEYTHPEHSTAAGINISNQYTEGQQKEAPKLRIEGSKQFPVYLKGTTDINGLKNYLTEYIDNASLYYDSGVKRGLNVNMAQIVTDKVILATSATGLLKEIQEIEKSGKTVDEYLEFWDEMIDLYYKYGGYSIDPKDKNSHNYRPRGRAVLQINENGGWAAGLAADYSVTVTSYYSSPDRSDKLFSSIIRACKTPNWVIWHELGHAFENDRLRHTELTTNLFSLVAQDKIVGRENNRLNSGNMKRDLYNFHINKKEGQEAGGMMKLAMYYQLHSYLGYEWYGEIGKAYRKDANFFEGNNFVDDRYVIGIAKLYKINTASHFEHYGVKISDEAKAIANKYATKNISEKFYLADMLPESIDDNPFRDDSELIVNLSHTRDGKTKLDMHMDRPTDSLLAYEIYRDNKLIAITDKDTFIDNNTSSKNYYVIAVDQKYNTVRSKIIGESVYLSDINEKSAKVGWGSFRKDKAPNGNPITLLNAYGHDEVFDKGIGAHTQSEVVYDIRNKGYDKFLAKIGVDRSMKHAPYDESIVSFQVFVDGKKEYDSDRISVRQRYKEVEVDITGASEIKLVTNSLGKNWYDQTVWADAKFVFDKTPREVNISVDENIIIEEGESINLLDHIDIVGGKNAVATNVVVNNGNIDTKKVGTYAGTVSLMTAGVKKQVTVPVNVVAKRDYISDLDAKTTQVGWGEFRKDKAPNGSEINLLKPSGEEATFTKGIGAHAPSKIVYDIKGKGYDTFYAKIGIDRDYKDKPLDQGIVAFKVYVDNKLAYDSKRFTVRDPLKNIKVDIEKGASEIRLETETLGNNWSDQTVWADAMLTTNEGQSTEYVEKNIIIKRGDRNLDIAQFVHAEDRYGNRVETITIDETNVDRDKSGEYTAVAIIETSGAKKYVDVPVKVVAASIYASEIKNENIEVVSGKLEKDLLPNGTQISLKSPLGHDVTIPKGLVVSADSEVVYNVKDSGFTTFFATTGIDRSIKHASPNETLVKFKVFVDDRLDYESPVIDVTKPYLDVKVNISGAEKVKLVTESIGGSIAHSVWGGAAFTMDENPVEVIINKDLIIKEGSNVNLEYLIYDNVTIRYKTGEEIWDFEVDQGDLDINIPGEYYLSLKIKHGGGITVKEVPVTVVANNAYLSESKVYLSELKEDMAKVGWGRFRKNTDIEGGTIELLDEDGKEVTFEKGLGTHAPATIVYNVKDKGYTKFLAKAGIDRGFKNTGKGRTIVEFKVYVDDILEYRSGRTDVWQALKNIDVNIKEGASTVTLEVDSLGSNAADHAVWADAMFTNAQAPQISSFSLPTPSVNTEILEIETEEDTEVLEIETKENTEALEMQTEENTEVLDTEINESTEVLDTEINENIETLDAGINITIESSYI